MSETKSISGVEIKSESEGRVIARFATYDEIDHHGDVTYKGAFEDGAEVVVSSYNHTSWGGSLPVGKGVIRDGGDGAYADLHFFMHTQAGRDTFETVKALGKLQQWSYGFDVVEKDYEDIDGEKSIRALKKLKVHEVSPVLLGAGKSTRTIAVKDGQRTMDKLEAAGYSIEDVIELLEEKAKGGGKPKPKPKPGQDDDNSSKKPNGKKPSDDDEEEDDEDEENDNSSSKKPNQRRGKKPSGSGKMRMSDQTDAVITALKELADRAEEIVTLRKSQGKSDVSDALQEQFTELLKQADRIFDLLPQDEEGFLLMSEEHKAAAEMAELQNYAFSLSEEL